MDITRYAPGKPVNHRLPVTNAQADLALDNIHGDDSGAVRYVSLRLSGLEHADVHAPQDGRVLLLDVQAGHPHLTICSGRTILHVDSRDGVTLTVEPQATLTVITTSGCQIDANVDDAATLIVYAAAGTTGAITAMSADSTVSVNGIGHNLTVHPSEARATTPACA